MRNGEGGFGKAARGNLMSGEMPFRLPKMTYMYCIHK